MLKAVIFDMDGVIIDSEKYHFEIESRIFDNLGLDISIEERNSFVGGSGKKMWSYIKDKFGLNESVDQLLEHDNNLRFDYLSSLDNLEPIPGIPDLLKELHQNRLKVALASSSSIRVVDNFIKKLNLDQCFHKIVSGDSIENGKPEPDIFIYTAKLIEEEASNCTVIEDSANGVRAAKSAKMKCVGFNNPNSGSQDLSPADIIIDDIRALDCKRLRSLWEPG